MARRSGRAAAQCRSGRWAGTSSVATRRWSTRGRPWTSRCSPPRRNEIRRWPRGPAGCCGCRCPRRSRRVEKGLDPRTRLVLGANPDGSLAALLDDCADAAVDVLAPTAGVDRSRVQRPAGPGGRRVGRDHPRHRGQGRQGAHRAARGGGRAAGAAVCRAGRGGRRHPRTTGRAASGAVRHRHRCGAPRRSHPLPDGGRPTARAAAARPRGRPGADGPRARRRRTPTTNCCKHFHRPARPRPTSATSPG